MTDRSKSSTEDLAGAQRHGSRHPKLAVDLPEPGTAADTAPDRSGFAQIHHPATRAAQQPVSRDYTSSPCVLVARTELVPHARPLAQTWGCSPELVPAAELRDRVETALELAAARVMLVALCADLKDDLLVAALNVIGRFVAGEEAWEACPQFTLLTGRSPAQVARLCERLRASDSETEKSARFVHFQGSDASAEAIFLEREPGSGERVERSKEGGEKLADLVRRPASVIAYQTHGGEACARGGGGVVLCGRSLRPAERSAGTAGILACGRGLACPRGPLPLPMRELQAQVFLLVSCNGLRLADGALQDDFNLGLSLLDGIGQAYISSITGTRGADLVSKIFLAAVCSGVSLGEATALINAAMIRSRVDAPSFVAIGSPSLVVAPDAPRPHPVAAPVAEGILELAAGDQHFADLVIDDARMLALVEEDALLLAAPEPAPVVMWFCRREAVASRPDGATRRCVRLFLFRYPETIGQLRLEIGDRRQDAQEALGWRRSLGRWLELWRTFGLAERDPEAYKTICDNYDQTATQLSLLLSRLAWSTAGRAQLQKHFAIMRLLSRTATEFLLPELVPRLGGGSFWLTNESAGYQLLQSRRWRCLSCDRPGMERRVQNPVSGDARHIRSCGRCGIVFDGPAEGSLRDLRLQAPNVVRCGDRFRLAVEVDVAAVAAGQTLSVYPRLAIHGLTDVKAKPVAAGTIPLVPGLGQILTFTLEIPAALFPHQHFIKVLAATEQELVFASRPLFVE